MQIFIRLGDVMCDQTSTRARNPNTSDRNLMHERMSQSLRAWNRSGEDAQISQFAEKELQSSHFSPFTWEIESVVGVNEIQLWRSRDTNSKIQSGGYATSGKLFAA